MGVGNDGTESPKMEVDALNDSTPGQSADRPPLLQLVSFCRETSEIRTNTGQAAARARWRKLGSEKRQAADAKKGAEITNAQAKPGSKPQFVIAIYSWNPCK